MKLYELIVEVAQNYLSLQNENGSFEAGHNGPYYDDELPIRNTSHVLMLLLKAYDITQDDVFLKAGKKAVEYILDDERRPMEANFWCRKNPSKDFCNGLIGPAWILEALSYAQPYYPNLSCEQRAEHTFLLHPFIEKTGVWRAVNVDGSYSGVDLTFNHQLWFAAAGAFLKKNAVIDQRITKFLDCLDVNLDIYANGLIMHALQPKRPLKLMIRDHLRFQKGVAYKNHIIHKAIGYHAFNTYAFALIYQHYSSHHFWHTDKFKKILNFLFDPLYTQGLDFYIKDPSAKKKLAFNKYGYAYNPPGIEVAYTLQTFQGLYDDLKPGIQEEWLSRQFDNVFSKEQRMMNDNTDDPITLSARFYEAVRLDDLTLGVD